MSIEEQVWKFLRGKGVPEKSVAAIMGNIQAESEFDIKKIEVGGGGGFGLIQWTNPRGSSTGRRTELERYGKTLDHQLNFLWAELTGEGSSVTGAKKQWIQKAGLNYNSFMAGQGSISELTTSFMRNFLRPKDIESSSHLQSRRIPKASEYYTKFTGLQGDYTPNAIAGENNSGLPPTMEVESTNYQVVKDSEKKGDFLFGRRYRITVSNESGRTIDVSQLHCTFSVLKTIQMEPNLSEISIYNLNVQTENDIKTNGTRVTIEAGYEGSNFGLIFDGDIIQCIQEKEEAHTYKLTIIALDSDRAINFEIANFSIMRGQTHREMVETIVNNAKYPMELGSISDKLNNTKLTRGKVFFGKSSDYLKQIAKSNGLQFYMDDGKVNLIDLKDLPKDEIIKLSPESGLIGTPEQTDYGVSGQCLLNPHIKLNSLIHIENNSVREKRIEFGTSNTIPADTGTSDSSSSTGGQLSSGGYLIPYDGKFTITSHFGPRNGSNHNGIDIGMPVGTPIYASKAGRVLKSGTDSAGINSGGGKIVMLTHQDGSATNYFHLSDWRVKTGDTVRQGQIIGLSGNTGFSTGPHLHFEIKEGGKFKNPLSVIQGGSGKAPPSTPSVENSPTTTTSGDIEHTQSLIRALDKDGIYRVVKLEYQGNTRGNEWFVNFESISQVGGSIPIIST